jgi:hypothetical protein
MQWYQYLAVLFSGLFLCNAAPHLVTGMCGNKFPTPFSKPPGKGLSSAPVNVLWGLFNMVAGYLLYTVAPIDTAHPVNLIIFFAGITAIGLMHSIHFQHKDKE